MKESKHKGNWIFQYSDLDVPPSLVLEQNRSDNDDPIVTALLASNSSNDDNNYQDTASLLRSRLDVLLSNDDVQSRDKRKLIRELVAMGCDKKSLTDSKALQRARDLIFHKKVREMIYHCIELLPFYYCTCTNKQTYNISFGVLVLCFLLPPYDNTKKIRYATCDPFPPQLAILIDLSFLPDEFFSPTSQPEIAQHYDRMVANPKSEVGTFREFMHWGAAKNFGCRFQFGGDECHTETFVDVLDHFLIKYGGKDREEKEEEEGTTDNVDNSNNSKKSSMSLRDEWSLGWLSTVCEYMQDPHMDYGHVRLGQYRNMTGRRSRNINGDVLLPWSFDMPLTEGGLRLAFYGIDDPSDPSMLLETPVEMFVPPKHVMLWR